MRYGGGMGAALHQLLAGRLDVAFGRTEGLGQAVPAELTRRLVRYEPLALLILADHPLAALDVVPLERLRGMEIDASSGNTDAPSGSTSRSRWLEAFGARPSAPHPHVVGVNETARHLQSHGLPILTMSECPAVPGRGHQAARRPGPGVSVGDGPPPRRPRIRRSPRGGSGGGARP